MATQFDQMLAAIRKAETVDDSVLAFIASVSEQFAGLRAQLASRGDPTAELDAAIANLNTKSEAVLLAIKANTPSEGEPIVPPAEKPAAAVIVDPNTLPARGSVIDDTPPGEFPSLAIYVSAGYRAENYETAKANFYAAKTAAGEPVGDVINPPQNQIAAPQPPQNDAGMPVLPSARAGQTSAELNATGAVPEQKSPDELAAEHAADGPPPNG